MSHKQFNWVHNAH